MSVSNWWLKRDKGCNSVRLFVQSENGDAEDKQLMTPDSKKTDEINITYVTKKDIFTNDCVYYIKVIVEGKRCITLNTKAFSSISAGRLFNVE